MDLEAARDREVASHERLSRAVSMAEKAITERETYARIVSRHFWLLYRSNMYLLNITVHILLLIMVEICSLSGQVTAEGH